MRSGFWTLLIGCTLAAAWVSPAVGQSQYVKASISIENVVVETAGTGPQPFSMPLSAPINLEAPCGAVALGTVTMNVVDNGIDIALDAQANTCAVTGTVRFDVVLDVPIVSTDAVAFLWLVPEAGAASLVNLPYVPGSKGSALLSFDAASSSTSSELSGPLATDIPFVRFAWTTDPTTLGSGSVGAQMFPLFPGDQVRIPIVAQLSIKPATSGGNLNGSISGRFEFKTRLPLPVTGLSPSLSIPFGVMGLTGLARLRV